MEPNVYYGDITVVAAGGQTRPLRYCVIRGLSSDSCRWRNRDSRHIIATQAGRRHGFLCSVLHLSQENVLSYPNASRKCVLFWENVLGGTKCIINVVAAGGQTRPLRYCVIRGLSSASCRWRNGDMVGQNTLQYYFRQPGRMILVDFYRNQLIAWYL